MREIKFRAWDKDNKKIIKWEKLVKNHTVSVDPDISPERFTFMQFTGLLDKNGKDIYEGDIVRILYTNWISKSVDDSRTLQEYKNDISEIGVVKYSYDSFKLEIKNDFRTLYEGDHGEKEVINNIYENPDLIH